ncbi:MAG: hypothetical protein HY907_15145 [Deltaproteobacteria bacterium]|nr:hypothetical protein [Deltaproteobacteria bacterium]
MPAADRLIDALRAEGRQDSDGAFTLDRDKAREKLRQFQLPDPRRYVLLLVEAAVLKGATRIDFAIDADDMELRCDGRPFTAADFEHIYASMFSPADTDDLRARRQLALGLNAAMALHPRHVRIASGDGETGASLELRPRRPDRIGAPDEVPRGTVIRVKDRFRPGLAVRFFRNLNDRLAEETFLRAGCRYARCDVRLEGRPLAVGREQDLAEAGGLFAEVDAGDVRGFVRLRPRAEERARILLVTNGVLVAEHEEIELPPGFICVIDCARLRKDVSQQDIVRDEVHQEAVDAASRACDGVLALLCDRWGDGWDEATTTWARGLLRSAAERCAGVFREHAQRGAPVDGLPAKLLRAPLFAAAHGEFVPLARIIEEAKRYAECEYAREPCATRFDDGRAVLLLPDDDLHPFLTRVLGVKLNDATRWLHHLERQAKLRARFLERRAPAVLPDASLRFRRPFALPQRTLGGGVTAKAVEGEVALQPYPDWSATLRVVSSGCLLGERTSQVLRGIAIVVAGEFAPNRDYDDATNDEALADAVLAAAEQLEPLCRACARSLRGVEFSGASPGPGAIRGWLYAALVPGLGRHLLEAFRFSPVEAKRLCDERRGAADRFLPALGIGRLRTPAPSADGAAPPPSPRVHPAALLPLFPAIGVPQSRSPRAAGMLSLAGIEAESARTGSIAWCSGPVAEGVAAKSPTLVLDAPTRELLVRVFGAEALRDGSAELAERAAAQAHAFATPEPVVVPGELLANVPLSGDGFDGSLAVPLEAASSLPEGVRSWPPQLRVRILRERRPLGRRSFLVPFGPLRGVVNADAIRPNPLWNDVDDPEATARIGEAARRASRDLLAALCRRLGTLPPDRRRAAAAFLLEAAASPFPRKAFRAVWNRLREASDPPSALAAYRALLACAAGRELSDVVAALELLSSVSGGLTVAAPDFPAALDDLLRDSPVPKDAPRGELVARLFDDWLAGPDRGTPSGGALPVPAVLAGAPLLESIEHRPVTLVEASALARTTGRIPFVPDTAPDPWPDPPADGGTVLRLDERTREILPRILGPVRLDDVRMELRRARRVQALETLPAMRRVGLEEGTTLVSEPIATNTVTGEVGLPAAHDGTTALHLTVCTKKRRLLTVPVPCTAALRAVVDDDALGVDPDALGGVGQADLDRLAALCTGLVPHLVRRLAERWPVLPPGSRAAAWTHLLDYLRASPPPPPPSRRDELVDRLARLDGFVLADGRTASLEDLTALARRTGRLVHAAPDERHGVPEDLSSLVVAVRSFESSTLDVLFPQSVSASALSAAEWQALRPRPAAPPGVVQSSAIGSQSSVSGSQSSGRPEGAPGGTAGPAVRPQPRAEARGSDPEAAPKDHRALLDGRAAESLRGQGAAAPAPPAEPQSPQPEAPVPPAVPVLSPVRPEAGELEHGEATAAGAGVEFSIELRFLDALRGELRRYVPLLGAGLSPDRAGRNDARREGPSAAARPGGGKSAGDDAARARVLAMGVPVAAAGPQSWDAVDLAIVRGSPSTVASVRGPSLVLHLENPAVQLAMQRFEQEPIVLSFLVSALYTVFNVHSAAVTDADEAEFQQAVAPDPR